MSENKPIRRNAQQTKAMILNSARKLFAAKGYDGVGVREIAAGAGITAMMVNRYFGSKEKLFVEAARLAMADRVILTRENKTAKNPALAFTRALVAVTNADAIPLDGFKIITKSAGSKSAVRLGKKLIEAGHYQEMKEMLKGKRTGERAGILLSLITGLQMNRQTLKLSDLAKSDDEILVELLLPIIEKLILG